METSLAFINYFNTGKIKGNFLHANLAAHNSTSCQPSKYFLMFCAIRRQKSVVLKIPGNLKGQPPKLDFIKEAYKMPLNLVKPKYLKALAKMEIFLALHIIKFMKRQDTSYQF